MSAENKDNNSLNVSELYITRRPISWLMRELQKQLEKGNDYVEIVEETHYGDTETKLHFSE